ncbi:unnamed protein product [Allacma fusca]|uniref:Uncharacterized protein n=1 Tax=Allacma fusca TaxID=39272 RepID=A0A8J2J823_9HEXA|nr:unnamed protein product [Allacma fusca]
MFTFFSEKVIHNDCADGKNVADGSKCSDVGDENKPKEARPIMIMSDVRSVRSVAKGCSMMGRRRHLYLGMTKFNV